MLSDRDDEVARLAEDEDEEFDDFSAPTRPNSRRLNLPGETFLAVQERAVQSEADEARKAEIERTLQFARWLRDKQENSKRSVREVAKDIGVAHVTLRSWLLGHNLPSSDAARKLARYYKVDEDWLLEMSGHRTGHEQITTDPERQEFLMWANANIEKIPVKQLRALRRMMEELAADEG